MPNAKPAARITDPTQHGGMLATGSVSVTVEGLPAARLADLHVCPEHVGGAVIEVGSAPVSSAMPAARQGDMVLCPNGPHQITSGASRTSFGTNVHIGGSSLPMPDVGGDGPLSAALPVAVPQAAVPQPPPPAPRGGGEDGKKYPPPTENSNNAAKLVRDIMKADAQFNRLHSSVGVFEHADGKYTVGLSGDPTTVSASAAILKSRLSPSFMVNSVSAHGAHWPGFVDAGQNVNVDGVPICSEPRLSLGAETYQSQNPVARSVKGMSVFWRGMRADGTPKINKYPVPLEERGPGGADLDLMRPCINCSTNENTYMENVSVASSTAPPTDDTER